ncbi:hypothetical protein AU509_05725 [Lonsdalea britannica]|uniref:DUF202 domain-containing protein n=1 Tax=Lonsdalea britannica TaxID=1082704 RepID=A0AAD0SF37_9GAMM|nr:DUF202 domain-containing protein [Lonsdalea britannica]AXW86551.1 DUF202 domain-containing protein [Lonsdalea britannica]OSM98680.1 hypothetical protein AU509_05725 [Lonsdalea britannica]OSN09744.1 hypothetical protein AU510_00855 [Lonsdalea britannica]
MSSSPLPRDPGVQPERTVLAWSRTAILLLVNTALLLKAGTLSTQPLLLAAGILLLLASLTIFIWVPLRLRGLQNAPKTHRIPPAIVMRGFTLTFILIALLIAGHALFSLLLPL